MFELDFNVHDQVGVMFESLLIGVSQLEWVLSVDTFLAHISITTTTTLDES